jgi:DNA-binding transcriptional ArsR family regulator
MIRKKAKKAGRAGDRPNAKNVRRRAVVAPPQGCSASVVVTERVDRHRDESRNTWTVSTAIAATGPSRGKRSGKGVRLSTRACDAFAAIGHPMRARILAKLTEGPATYRDLERVTRLKAGPMYHHINQLRLAGLILPKQRDLYELTRGGRNLLAVAMAAAPMLSDRRRRPLGA